MRAEIERGTERVPPSRDTEFFKIVKMDFNTFDDVIECIEKQQGGECEHFYSNITQTQWGYVHIREGKIKDHIPLLEWPVTSVIPVNGYTEGYIVEYTLPRERESTEKFISVDNLNRNNLMGYFALAPPGSKKAQNLCNNLIRTLILNKAQECVPEKRIEMGTRQGWRVTRGQAIFEAVNLYPKVLHEDAQRMGRKSISEAKNLLMTALKLYGVRTEFNVTLPPKKPQITNLPTPAQVIQLVRGTDIELPCMLALWLSLRVSEVRGLQFGDLKDGVLTVQRSKLALANRDVVREVNKTYLSTRQLVLPPYLIGLIQAIPHTSEDEFIVPMSYQAIRAHLTKLARAKGYTLTFHQLRHLNASVMLSLGVPDKYAMERGGWATNSTLKNVYQHTFSEERKQVDEMIDRYFEEALNKEDTLNEPEE